MKRTVATATASAALLLGSLAGAGAAVAAEPNGCGNGQAVWKAAAHEALGSGFDWGKMASDWASGTEHKGGVSEGVHDAKADCKG